MKRIRQVCSVLVICGMAVSLQAAPVIENPAVMPDAMLSVTVSDLHGFIDGIGEVAAKASPMMNGTFIKSMAGMQLGDPGLAGIAPGKGFSIVAMDATNIFAVVEVEEARIGAYTNALAPKGIQFKYGNGLLVVGRNAEQVARGWDQVEAVQGRLLTKRLPGLRIAMQPTAIIERNSEQIQGMLEMMTMLMGQNMMQAPGATLESTQVTLRILEGEFRVLLSVAAQCDVAEMVLAPKNGSVRISKTLVPKPGTRFDTLLKAPRIHPPNPRVRAGYLGGGAISLDASISNPEALKVFLLAEMEQLSKEMQLDDIDLPALMETGCNLWAQSGGSMSETVDFGPGISVGYLMEVKDEATALALVKSMPQDMKPLFKLYDNLDMPMTLEFRENARAYNGTAVHQLIIGLSLTNQPPEVAAQLTAMNLTNLVYDIAVVDNIMIFAMEAEKVGPIIDRLKNESFKPVSLKACAVYPEGGFYYLDFDVSSYIGFIASFMPDSGNPMMKRQMTSLLQGAEPITSAGYKEDGRIMWSVNIPGDLIGKFGQLGMMMQMQQMQQQSTTPPQAVPEALPPPP